MQILFWVIIGMIWNGFLLLLLPVPLSVSFLPTRLCLKVCVSQIDTHQW